MLKQIIFNGDCYHIHPVYELYASNIKGHVIDTDKKENVETVKYGNLLYIVMKYHHLPYIKLYSKSKLIWECFHGVISKYSSVVHLNDDKRDNRLYNLKLISPNDDSDDSD